MLIGMLHDAVTDPKRQPGAYLARWGRTGSARHDPRGGSVNEEDDMYIALLVVALLSVSALGVYIWRQQWHTRLAREIRALPEHVGERVRL